MLRRASGENAPPVTITLLIEGEEESGSPHFAKLLRERRDQLGPDVIVISDTTMWAADTPSICTGMRGLAEAEITADRAVPRPALRLVRRRRAEPGARPRQPARRACTTRTAGSPCPASTTTWSRCPRRSARCSPSFPSTRQSWLADAGDSGATYGEAGYTTLERIWARPTAEVNGLWGGHTGPGGKTIIPKAAHAKLSFRLVADQEPAQGRGVPREDTWAPTPNGVTATVTAQPRGPSLPVGDRLARRGRGPPGHGAGVRQRGAVHQGGRQRPGGGPGRHPGRAARLRGRGP